jgi:hypothetical protein
MIFYCCAIAKTGVVDSTSRIDTVYGAYFYGILLLAMACLCLLNKYPKVFTIFPLVLSILFIETTLNHYSSSDMSDTPPQQKYLQTKVWLQQIQDADLAGKSSVILEISPGLDINISDDNLLSKTLYAHHITTQTQPLLIEYKYLSK